jgi:ATP-dependent Zn protease
MEQPRSSHGGSLGHERCARHGAARAARIPRRRGGYSGTKPYSEEAAKAIELKCFGVIDKSHDQARRLLREHREKLDTLAKALLEKESHDE